MGPATVSSTSARSPPTSRWMSIACTTHSKSSFPIRAAIAWRAREVSCRGGSRRRAAGTPARWATPIPRPPSRRPAAVRSRCPGCRRAAAGCRRTDRRTAGVGDRTHPEPRAEPEGGHQPQGQTDDRAAKDGPTRGPMRVHAGDEYRELAGTHGDARLLEPLVERPPAVLLERAVSEARGATDASPTTWSGGRDHDAAGRDDRVGIRGADQHEAGEARTRRTGGTPKIVTRGRRQQRGRNGARVPGSWPPRRRAGL